MIKDHPKPSFHPGIVLCLFVRTYLPLILNTLKAGGLKDEYTKKTCRVLLLLLVINTKAFFSV